MIKAFIANIEKYNEGELCGEWFKLPATQEEMKALFARIGVDGVLCQDYIITGYENSLAGMHNLSKYEWINDLNYLASLLSEMNEAELVKFEAAAVYGDNNAGSHELINLAQNLDCYDYLPGVRDEDDLGRYVLGDKMSGEIPEWLTGYTDYDEYGRDVSISEGGEFIKGGYICRNDERFIEHYDGLQAPKAYRIFAYPDPPEKMPIKAQLEMYGKMVSYQIAERPAPARDERA